MPRLVTSGYDETSVRKRGGQDTRILPTGSILSKNVSHVRSSKTGTQRKSSRTSARFPSCASRAPGLEPVNGAYRDDFWVGSCESPRRGIVGLFVGLEMIPKKL